MKELERAESCGRDPLSVAKDTIEQLLGGTLGRIMVANIEKHDTYVNMTGLADPGDCYCRGFGDGAAQILKWIMTGEMQLTIAQRDIPKESEAEHGN